MFTGVTKWQNHNLLFSLENTVAPSINSVTVCHQENPEICLDLRKDSIAVSLKLVNVNLIVFSRTAMPSISNVKELFCL